jgi:hypothetical protein
MALFLAATRGRRAAFVETPPQRRWGCVFALLWP